MEGVEDKSRCCPGWATLCHSISWALLALRRSTDDVDLCCSYSAARWRTVGAQGGTSRGGTWRCGRALVNGVERFSGGVNCPDGGA